MEKDATGSAVRAGQRQEDGGEKAAPSSGGSAPRRRRRKDMTPEEWSAAMAYIRALMDDYKVYDDMREEDVEEEYRRAGKLDKYDPETELQKRVARVAKKHPPPAGFDDRLEEYFKLIEDEED
ncbi:unnamed protein product [Urochloa decumbens]|uniref:Uncharacterized protein n=1 Tax=Urochloa decumbens TaxID=240449 RepID=A0ABC8ZDG0_9POAL